MSASEKFELEKEYGLWESDLYKELYDEIETNIANGLNYNWLKVPITYRGLVKIIYYKSVEDKESWNYSLI